MVKIYKDYYVDADNTQMKLVQKDYNKDGKEFYRLVGYYTRFEPMFNRLIEQCGRDAIINEEAKDVQDILSFMKEARDFINDAFEELEVKVAEDRVKERKAEEAEEEEE